MRSWIGLFGLLLLPPIAGGDSASAAVDSWRLEPAAEPAEERRLEVLRWHEGYEKQMLPVLDRWRAMELAIRDGRLDRLDVRCREFRRVVQALDRTVLMSTGEPAIRLHLGRALRWLEAGEARCDRRRLFDLVYHLSRARAALAEVDEQVNRFR